MKIFLMNCFIGWVTVVSWRVGWNRTYKMDTITMKDGTGCYLVHHVASHFPSSLWPSIRGHLREMLKMANLEADSRGSRGLDSRTHTVLVPSHLVEQRKSQRLPCGWTSNATLQSAVHTGLEGICGHEAIYHIGIKYTDGAHEQGDFCCDGIVSHSFHLFDHHLHHQL